jgi:2-polyprenyl-6-methoxyphenol hydroxylase-like FAD-dependent oxidoreductase
MRTVMDPAAEVPVVGEFDVLVVGGGSAGVAAAIAAAREGARTCLLERHGFAGGMATGGLVIVLDDWADGEALSVGGLARETVKRLVTMGAAVETAPGDWPRHGDEVWWRWARWGFEDHYARRHPKPITYGVSFDAELLKCLLNDMLEEARVTLRLHSWAVRAVMDGPRVGGVIVETKGGRQALLARVVIDASGDGDVFASAGAPHQRSRYMVTLAHRLGGVDVERALAFERTEPAAWRRVDADVRRLIGGSWDVWWLRTTQEGVVWCNCPHLVRVDALSVEDLTRAEIESRRRILRYLTYVRARLPGFEGAYLLETAPQIGVRQTRLLDGEYRVTKEDVLGGRPFGDTVARGRNYSVPYRALLPRGVDGLLVAGRCYSATPEAQRMSREIPPCMAMGEAAGAAAALAVRTGVAPRAVAVATLQARLAEHGAAL